MLGDHISAVNERFGRCLDATFYRRIFEYGVLVSSTYLAPDEVNIRSPFFCYSFVSNDIRFSIAIKRFQFNFIAFRCPLLSATDTCSDYALTTNVCQCVLDWIWLFTRATKSMRSWVCACADMCACDCTRQTKWTAGSNGTISIKSLLDKLFVQARRAIYTVYTSSVHLRFIHHTNDETNYCCTVDDLIQYDNCSSFETGGKTIWC